jgi:putative hydrolase of the HAD superfamily
MNQRPALIWDFDGTLAYQEGKWSGAMLAAMDELAPGHGLTLKDVRPLMSSGFPWDKPEKLHPELTDPQAWWAFLEAYLMRVALTLGFNEDQARRIARQVHHVQADCRSYHLFPDTQATLDRLKSEGYRMIILSNHVP